MRLHPLLLLLLLIPAISGAAVRGVVKDAVGEAVSNARVDIRSAAGDVLATVTSDAQGRFEWTGAGAAIVSSGTSERAVNSLGDEVELNLATSPISTSVTVTARRGAAEETSESPHLVVVKEAAAIASRPAATLGNALEREPGIMVQQSTYGQVSPFLRGLTGYQVLNVIDGVRFNNSTFRSGPNQYLAFIEPMQAQRVEALLGPTGSQYGSDALGGTIHVITPEARFASFRGWETHGQIQLTGASADWSGTGGARLSMASEKLFWLGGVSGRKHNDLRAGGGLDSRNAFHRFLGMPLGDVRGLLGSRQQDTGFRQYGLQTKLAWRPREGHIATLNYQRGVQADVRGYKDLLGGLGRMLSAFDPQVLNWFHGRYEKLGLGPLDSLSGTFSWNSQTDGSRRQNLRLTDPITEDFNRVNAYGYTAQAAAHWGSRAVASFGGEIYDERIASRRDVTNVVSGAVTRPRPLYPDGSQYQNLGLFGQAGVQLTSRLRTDGGLRVTAVRFRTVADAVNGIPGSSQWFRDATFHASARYQIAGPFGVHAVVSRGFRAPNLNDLGALGLNDLGYEVPSSSAREAGALLSTDSGESALAKGTPLGTLTAESLMNYEFGARVSTSRIYARVQFFDAELTDPIVRRTLLFPASNAPSAVAGLPVTVLPQTVAQRAQGVVAVATAIDPRAVKSFVNDGNSRYYGAEALTRYSVARHWTVEANYTYLLGRDLNPNRNIRRLPPQSGTVSLHHGPSGRRPWWELSATVTGAQERLSGGDRDDERIGASRNLQDIAAFFAGSRVAPYLNGGIFMPTGESLEQIQNRVLPGASAATRVPLYQSTAGWVALNLRGGYPISERLQAMAAWDNILDRNYRVHGSGMDAPSRSAYLGLSYVF